MTLGSVGFLEDLMSALLAVGASAGEDEREEDFFEAFEAALRDLGARFLGEDSGVVRGVDGAAMSESEDVPLSASEEDGVLLEATASVSGLSSSS